MVGIGSLNMRTTTSSELNRTAPVAMGQQKELKEIVKSGADTSGISSLAKQLADAALRAEKNYAHLPRSELSKYAWAITERISGATYRMGKSVHDAEVPVGDAERMARAEQATLFSNGKAANPFSSLTDAQLALIAYDEGGDFTINERHAADREFWERECAWSQRVVGQLSAERARTGKTSEAMNDILAHYQNMPAIQLALYSGDPIANTQFQIALEASGEIPEMKLDLEFKSLFTLMAEWEGGLQIPKEPKEEDEAKGDKAPPESINPE